MHISSFSLRNFRSFTDVQIEGISPTLSVVAAPNATGKTNFLEAIHIVLRGKSFRSPHETCVRWGEDLFFLKAVIENGENQSQIHAQYHVPSRRLRIEENRVPVSPIALYTEFPLVLFLPDDTFLFLRGPSMRRNFLNQALSSSPSYLSAIVQYSRALKQRNTALKTAKSPEDIAHWTALLNEQATSIWASRDTLVSFMNHHLPTLYHSLFGGSENVEVKLSRGLPDGSDLATALAGGWEYEQRYRYTLYGPHRDDLEVLIDGRPAQNSLSRGQMRMLVLSLKLGVFQFMKKVGGKAPIVLLDEVLSELDADRQQHLLEHLPEAQIFLTCTAVPEAVKNRDDAKILNLQELLLPAAKTPIQEKVAVHV
ncbi:MAG: DNA replication and repair protein RecF [Candidatus Andersenbacteria bacterium]|nr:DNA replication and repair protein RecF [Candidatus Andersenbacteria bacterium]MBI3250765.1 DNA replication and repair protein RecF [Candidatus Andersenbacteria bacterium]